MKHIKNFKKTIARLTIQPNERFKIKIHCVPYGINLPTWRKYSLTNYVKDKAQSKVSQYRGKRIVLGVDRIDLFKGLPDRYYGIQCFLKKYPKYITKVVFIHILAKTKDEKFPAFLQYYKKTFSLIANINQNLCSDGSTTMIETHFNLSPIDIFVYILACSKLNGIFLSTSTQEGLHRGVLEAIVASYFGGSPIVVALNKNIGVAEHLTGALKYQTNTPDDIADVLDQALSMPEDKVKASFNRNSQFALENNATFWAKKILNICGDNSAPKTGYLANL